jgi:peptidyl-tRNA hydrolase, PTH1 family
MKLIVGLGNPGKKYENTRHNMGFLFADYFADKNGIKLKKEHKGRAGRGEINGEKFILLKPETFMNLSGEAVQPVAAFNKVKNTDILVVHDDVDLPPLTVRIKKGGGDGGHNGLKSITEMIGDNSYIRVRVGAGRPENPQMDTADWVLSKIPDEQKEVLNKKFEIIEKFVSGWVAQGYDRAASKFKDE